MTTHEPSAHPERDDSTSRRNSTPDGAPITSPDGRHVWNGSAWQPVPSSQAPVGAQLGPQPKGSGRGIVGWLGVAAATVGLLLSMILWSQPAIFVGVVDVFVPFALGVGGLIAALRGGKAAKWIGITLAGLTILSCLIVILALMTTTPGAGGFGGN